MSGRFLKETLYRLPTASRSVRQAVLRNVLLFSLLDALLALSVASQYLAAAWGFRPSLGAPLLAAPAYPQPGLLAVAILGTGLLAAGMLLEQTRPLSLLLLPLPLPLFLAGTAPLYSPFAFVRWSSRFGDAAPLAARLDRAGMVLLGAFAVLLLPTLAYAALRLGSLRETGDTHGSAHWASPREVRRTGLLGQEPGIVLGAWGRGRRLRYLRDSSDRHVLLYAPSGSGKTTSVVIPTLLEWPGSVVVSDIKGELWHSTAGFRRSALGQVCLRFDPASSDGTAARYNPLLAIPATAEAVKYAQGVADVLCNPDGVDRAPDFWEQSAHSLLVGVILHVLFAEPEKTLATCARLLADPARGIVETLTAMLATRHDPALAMGWRDPVSGTAVPTHPVVAAAARAVLDMADRTAAGVVATARSHLELFRDPIVAENTGTSDFTAEDLVRPDRPVSLYLAVAPADLGRLRGLVRIVLNQLARRLTEAMDPAGVAGREPRLLLLLEEFPAWGRLDFLSRAIAYLRGYGIRVLVSIQALPQLFEVYGQHQSISANCGIQVAYAPNDPQTAQLLSQMTGSMTVHFERRSHAGIGALLSPGKVTVQPAEASRALLLPDEIRRLPEDEAIVFVAGHAPVRARRVPYYRDPVFAGRVRMAAPSSSDRLEHDWSHWTDRRAEAAPAAVPRPPAARLDALLEGLVGLEDPSGSGSTRVL